MVVVSLTPRMRKEVWAHLLESDRGTEEAAFLFANPAGANAFRAIEWQPVLPGGFSFCSAYHFELADDTRVRVIKRAHDLGACLVELHSHLDPDPPAFSPSDLSGFVEFVPHVWWRLKCRPYMAIVVSAGGLDGLVWRTGPDVPEEIAGVKVGRKLLPASHRSLSRASRGSWYG